MELSRGKKWAMIGLPIALIGVAAGVWFSLAPKQAELHTSAPTSSSDAVLTITNADNANLTILTAQIDQTIVDIQGPADQVGQARFYSDTPPNSKFDLPPNWGGLSGTITVPKGTLVELKPSTDTPVLIQDNKGQRPGAAGKPLIIDTTNVTQIKTGKSGINIEGKGAVEVEDETLNGSDEGGGESGTGNGPTQCGFGVQLLRDRCCARQQAGSATPSCPGQWAYNNASKLCEYQCTPSDESDQQNQTVGPPNSGGVGSDSGITPNPGAKPNDPTSAQCFSYSGDARSQCCDERLRNPLRIGPRPGFPDCIGQWIFDPHTLNCSFQCADYGTMLQILNELKQNQGGQ